MIIGGVNASIFKRLLLFRVGGSAGELGEEAGAKSWVNEQGNLCIGRKCIVTEATPEGLRFKLDADTCDPATRGAFIAAMIKGTRMTFNE